MLNDTRVLRAPPAAIALLSALIIACGGGGGYVKPSKNTSSDTSQVTIDGYVSGGITVPRSLQLHASVSEGQYWELRTVLPTLTTVSRHQISYVDGDSVVVEWLSLTRGSGWSTEYVIGYQGRLNELTGTLEVAQAWVGRVGQRGSPAVLSQAPFEADSASSGARISEQDFNALTVAGREWSGVKTSVVLEDGSTSDVWVAHDGWFGGLLRSTYTATSGEGFTSELADWGSHAKPLLIDTYPFKSKQVLGDEFSPSARTQTGQKSDSDLHDLMKERTR